MMHCRPRTLNWRRFPQSKTLCSLAHLFRYAASCCQCAGQQTQAHHQAEQFALHRSFTRLVAAYVKHPCACCLQLLIAAGADLSCRTQHLSLIQPPEGGLVGLRVCGRHPAEQAGRMAPRSARRSTGSCQASWRITKPVGSFLEEVYCRCMLRPRMSKQ